MAKDKKEPKEEKCSKEVETQEEADREEAEGEVEKMEEVDGDEEEDDKKKKKGKGKVAEENPDEMTEAGVQAPATITPNMGVPSKSQDVFVPQSSIAGSRMASTASSSGVSPSDVSYSGKSVETDLTKSPLFVGVSNQISELKKSIENKVDAVIKSLNDRVANIDKQIKQVEAFYSKSFNKAHNENNNPEAIVKKGISQQIAEGKVRYQ